MVDRTEFDNERIDVYHTSVQHNRTGEKEHTLIMIDVKIPQNRFLVLCWAAVKQERSIRMEN